MVTYSTEMEPRALALAISSGTRDALVELKRQVELAHRSLADPAADLAIVE